MATGTGQRRHHPPETGLESGPPDGDPPAVTVHAPAEAALALSLAGNRGVLLLSAPGAAGYLGPAWFLAMVAAAAAAVPGVPHKPVLDCADAPGQALGALRAGLRDLVLDSACPAFAQVAAAAAALGGRLRAVRPASLDLGPLDLSREGVRARLAAWLTGAGHGAG
ncbi:hypothetical protein E2C06_23310 [Dankookia rubra]|uniref:Uncharacterized protein n=1 Tax=Dankookia rubra TaxID=1442381 RepID=A0A4R5QAR8_9PROT|nr:hypothetical protein [Dankookia rubra]TDH60162.1 hypothetical protein E2C06_23310 [Dankookia rubra]